MRAVIDIRAAARAWARKWKAVTTEVALSAAARGDLAAIREALLAAAAAQTYERPEGVNDINFWIACDDEFDLGEILDAVVEIITSKE